MAAAAEVVAPRLGRGTRFSAPAAVWVAAGIVVATCLLLQKEWPWLLKYPQQWVLPFADWINVFVDWLIEHFKFLFRRITWLLEFPMEWVRDLLQWLPWPATIAGFTILAFVASGWRLAAFATFALLYMVVIGYWSESMNTLALVFVSVPMAIGIGLAIGIWAFKSRRIDRIVQPMLDLMQTFPTFAYLVPILLLFGFGPVVGLLASAIYAIPPMVRNVILGLRRVPSDVVESGVMSGTTRRQLLWWVQVPTALPTILMGVNQSVMAGLSMVIIAALIGSSADIGWEVVRTMRKAAFGQSLLAGIVIVFIAMMMDRISRGFAQRDRVLHAPQGSFWEAHRVLLIAVGLVGGLTLAAQAIPVLKEFPEDAARGIYVWTVDYLNGRINWLTGDFSALWDEIKKNVLFFLLIPLNVGLQSAVRPFSWGFELTPAMSWGYAAVVAALTVVAGRAWGWRVAVGIVLTAGTVYFGVSTTPWPAFILVVSLIAWQVGGWRLGMFALLGLLFIAVTGFWTFAMRSVYLCAAAVLTAFVCGGLLGVLAAHSDRLSAFIRPINDTLQTMPLFVFLIPVLMFFQIGEFTAYLAVIMYAIVPSVRYTELGLRNVPAEIVEAAKSMGCTGNQMLWQVKLPLAIPEIMLGLNQTIMFGLAMLVVAALVGTRGLGQQVYVAVTAGDCGKGVIAGLSITIIAITADRIIQAWSTQRKRALGLD